MICNLCEKECGVEFYPADRTCKECRKAKVRANRAGKAEYYKAYDRERFQNDPRVKARIDRYSKTEEGKASIKKAKKKWVEANASKRHANVMVGNAVRDKRIEKSDCCESCGESHPRIHGHHDDYAFPLVVRWLCPLCHTQWHKINGPGLNG